MPKLLENRIPHQIDDKKCTSNIWEFPSLISPMSFMINPTLNNKELSGDNIDDVGGELYVEDRHVTLERGRCEQM